MGPLNFKIFYGPSLGVKTPWMVTDVSIESEARQGRVLVECAPGMPLVNPETGSGRRSRTAGTPLAASGLLRRRSPLRSSLPSGGLLAVGFREFETVITAARVPRVLLKSGRTLMVSVPWAEAGGRFTKSFGCHVIELLSQCRTVRGAGRLVRRGAVEPGLSRRQNGGDMAMSTGSLSEARKIRRGDE